MPILESTEKMYEILGGLFQQLADDPEVGPRANDENINIVFYINNPDGDLWLLHGDPKPTVCTGACDAPPDIEMWISGDDCHAFWQPFPYCWPGGKSRQRGPWRRCSGYCPSSNLRTTLTRLSVRNTGCPQTYRPPVPFSWPVGLPDSFEGNGGDHGKSAA
jgi:hypothetical protein